MLLGIISRHPALHLGHVWILLMSFLASTDAKMDSLVAIVGALGYHEL
jgi:hypothetical protein